MIDNDDYCGATGGMFGRRNQSTRRKSPQIPLCPPKIPNNLTWARTPGQRRVKQATSRLSYCTEIDFPLSNISYAFIIKQLLDAQSVLVT
jgi:hypothetical protein